MYNIYIEMPSGCESKGFDRPTEEKALEVFDQMAKQLRTWPKFTAAVVMLDGYDEVQREVIHVD